MATTTDASGQNRSGVLGQLEDEIAQNPLDHKKWGRLIEHVISKDDEEQVRSVFERYFAIFKFDARQWSNYINFELNKGEQGKVVDLFAKCLPITDDVELCRTYVSYVRRTNDIITGGERARNTVVSAFDFAVDKVGCDIDSFELWNDYLDFYKTWTPATSYEQQQKNDLIRKLYKRCLVIPNAKIEKMWSEYTKWENEVSSPNVASKFIADLSTEYMEARSWNTEWHSVTKSSIKRRMVALSPTNDPNGVLAEQVELWFKWLDLEKKNSLNLKEEELQHRVEYVFKRAISILPFVPEMWYRYTSFLVSGNEEASRNKCIELLSDALKLNPRSFLLSFQLAEFYEKESAFPKAQGVFDSLIKILVKDHSLIQLQIEKLKSSKSKSSEMIKKNKLMEKEHGASSDSDEDDDDEPIIQYSESEALKLLDLELQLSELNKSVTSVYVNFMALCKRSQGIKEVRAVFKQRKNFKPMGYEFYVENALIEFYSDNKKISDKVFDLAMKTFSKDGGFLYAYLEYLILTNSIESLKVFFEMAITNLSKEISNDKELLQLSTTNILHQKKRAESLKRNQYFMKKMFRRYIRFASCYLNLDTVLLLEKRYSSFFPDDDEMSLFIDRYSKPFDGIAKYDLGERVVIGFEDDEMDIEEKENGLPLKKKRKTNDRDNYSPETSNGKYDGGSFNQQMPGNSQQHGFVGNTIYNLLQVLPNAGYFGPLSEHVFNSSKLVELFGNLTNVPGDS
ncbi:putative mRNA 3'-end-processing protein [Clavispora lusitaniae]|uniref:mRNA 3'-end-processing protein RNA14 n=1 Tax=Clavispora lusitaniae TaxID=36911 RepID=A0AA91PYS9_CLALS|nr:putative mRNA 3'-end-processing protein [Clavispora lusitaniae]